MVEDRSDTQNLRIFPSGFRFGARHVQILLQFILITLGYATRVNLSVAIVAMTDPKVNSTNHIRTYDWQDKNIILSSFYWGYIIPQIGAGQLAKTYGPKWFLIGAMLINSIFCIVTPFMAEVGSWGVIICRVAQGLGQGFINPSVHNMLSKWAPSSERSRFGSFVYGGGTFGTVLAMALTGWICSTPLGWPFTFYMYGTMGIIWTLLWIFIGKNCPADHKSIDPQEKMYIEESVGQQENNVVQNTPWLKFLTSAPFWATLIAQCTDGWAFSVLLTNIPTYLSSVLGFEIMADGLLSAGPYLSYWILSLVFSVAIDYVINSRIVSIGCARKVANSIAFFIPGGALLGLALISGWESDITTITIVLFFLIVGVNGCCLCGYYINHIDLSPNHAGTLLGITSAVSTIFSMLGPISVQYIVTDANDPHHWAIVFYVASAFWVFGNTIFVLFGSGEIQSWNETETKETRNSNCGQKEINVNSKY